MNDIEKILTLTSILFISIKNTSYKKFLHNPYYILICLIGLYYICQKPKIIQNQNSKIFVQKGGIVGLTMIGTALIVAAIGTATYVATDAIIGRIQGRKFIQICNNNPDGNPPFGGDRCAADCLESCEQDCWDEHDLAEAEEQNATGGEADKVYLAELKIANDYCLKKCKFAMLPKNKRPTDPVTGDKYGDIKCQGLAGSMKKILLFALPRIIIILINLVELVLDIINKIKVCWQAWAQSRKITKESRKLFENTFAHLTQLYKTAMDTIKMITNLDKLKKNFKKLKNEWKNMKTELYNQTGALEILTYKGKPTEEQVRKAVGYFNFGCSRLSNGEINTNDCADAVRRKGKLVEDKKGKKVWMPGEYALPPWKYNNDFIGYFFQCANIKPFLIYTDSLMDVIQDLLSMIGDISSSKFNELGVNMRFPGPIGAKHM